MAADDARVLQLLTRVGQGSLAPGEALEQLRYLPYEDIGFARLDHHRGLRQGLPEVIFGQGKSVEQVAEIVERLDSRAEKLLITRVGPEYFDAVAGLMLGAVYHPAARAITLDRAPALVPMRGIALVTGGTADLPVAEEAALTARLMGHRVDVMIDAGVAGIHRLLDLMPRLREANVVIAVAGMEGALPSVVGGLVDVPVVAVPTSVGYGANLGGLTPMLAMLNSCAPGLGVVNIDNGFGAGYLAAQINSLAYRGLTHD
ncbi:MAG: nickel pincer cofactor biosynthesis protein LarB [Chloroflexota bacterium]